MPEDPIATYGSTDDGGARHAHNTTPLYRTTDGLPFGATLAVVRCTIDNAPALQFTDRRLPGGAMMVCLDEDEAQAVADTLHALLGDLIDERIREGVRQAQADRAE